MIAIRDDVIGSGLPLDQPVAIELSSDRTTAYAIDGARVLAVRFKDGSSDEERRIIHPLEGVEYIVFRCG